MTKSIVLGLVLVLGLSSCSSGGSDTPAAPPEENLNFLSTKDWIAATCQFKSNEGDSALTDLPTSKVVSTLFSKKYNSALIDSVLTTNAEETTKFALLTGVKYFKVQNLDLNTVGCLFSDFLAAPPAGLRDYFRDAEEPTKEEKEKGIKSRLLGLYVEAEVANKAAGTPNMGASIMVKNDAERYTMIHEFMHHLFRLESSAVEKNSEETYDKTFADLKSAINVYDKDQSGSNLYEAALKASVFADAVIEILKSYTLEEMTIEHELSLRYESGKLQYIPKYGRINGDRYIMFSVENAEDRIKAQIEDLAAILTKESERNPEVYGTYKTNISQISSQMVSKGNQIKAAMNIEKNAAVKRLKVFKSQHKGLSSLSGIVAIEPGEKAVGCAHSQRTDAKLDDAQITLSNFLR